MRRCLLVACLLVSSAAADDLDKGVLREHNAEIVRLPDGRYRMGNVTIDAERRRIEMPGRVNMQEGLVELLACTPTGKLHESVLALDIKPLHLQLALLVLGLKPGRNPGVPNAGGDKRAPGERVEIRVSWEAGGKRREMRAEELILDQPKKRAMAETDWVFLGSQIWDTGLAADETGSLITTYHDPLAIIENPLDTVNDDTLYLANSRVVPAVGTKVMVVVSPVERKN